MLVMVLLRLRVGSTRPMEALSVTVFAPAFQESVAVLVSVTPSWLLTSLSTRAVTCTRKALLVGSLSAVTVVSPKVRVMSSPLPQVPVQVEPGGEVVKVPLKSALSKPPLAAAVVITWWET